MKKYIEKVTYFYFFHSKRNSKFTIMLIRRKLIDILRDS